MTGLFIEVLEALEQNFLEVEHTDLPYQGAGEVMCHC
jgi:hypothetical protein